MKAFLIGLITVIAVAILAGLGFLLSPLLIVLVWFLRWIVIFLLVLFAIWFLGKFIMFVWEKLRK